MTKLRDKLLHHGLELGMSVVQKVLAHPTVGPLMLRSVSQLMELKGVLEESRERLFHRMQIASQQEQEDLRTQVISLERKIERLERRLRELNKEARAARATQQREAIEMEKATENEKDG